MNVTYKSGMLLTDKFVNKKNKIYLKDLQIFYKKLRICFVTRTKLIVNNLFHDTLLDFRHVSHAYIFSSPGIFNFLVC